MSGPVWFRLQVEDELLCRFKGAAQRTGESPTRVIHRLMERFLEIERDRDAVDLTLWGGPVDRAGGKVMREGRPSLGAPVCELDDEVLIANKLGWASPTFGRRSTR